MGQLHYEDAFINDILKEIRPSFFVTNYLLGKGYKVFPVNPGHAGKEICGQYTYASLDEIKEPIDMVDIFRNSAAALDVTKEALNLKPLPKVIWMQFDVVNHEAAKLAKSAGVKVVMDRCPKVEYSRLCGEIGRMGIASNMITSKLGTLKGGYQKLGLPEN